MKATPEGPRVLHIVPALFDRADGVIGGAERFALELAHHMADATPTRLLTFGKRPRKLRLGDLGIEVAGRAWRVRGQQTNPVSPRVLRAILQADVIHCHQQHVLGTTLAALGSRLAGRRVFVTELGGGGWDVSAYVSTDRFFHGHLHLSAYSRHVHGHDGNPRAHVIHAGVDTTRFSPGPPHEAVNRAVFVGRLLPHKGINDLIAGLPEGVELDVIGEPYDPGFAADLRRLAQGKTVRFRNGCGDAELIDALRTARCVALPSVYTDMYGNTTRVPELLGLAVLEGMACGVPALVTDVASLPEVVTDRHDGFVVPPNDPGALRARLEWLRDHPDDAAAMGRAARETVERRFTWRQVVERCLRIYRGEGAAP